MIKSNNKGRFFWIKAIIISGSLAIIVSFALHALLKNKNQTIQNIKINSSPCFDFGELGTITGILQYGTLTICHIPMGPWYLKLESPICAKALYNDVTPNRISSDTIDLYFGPKDISDLYNKAEMFKGKKVKVYGSISLGLIKNKTTNKPQPIMIQCFAQSMDTLKVNDH